MTSAGRSSSINITIPKWQIALVVGAPVALGLGYVYYRNNSKPSLKPGRSEPKDTVKENGTRTDKQISVDGDVSSNITERPSEIALKKAQKFKQAGNKYFSDGKYDEAISYYTKAIETCLEEDPESLSIFYQNRAAAYDKLSADATLHSENQTKNAPMLLDTPNASSASEALENNENVSENLGRAELTIDHVDENLPSGKNPTNDKSDTVKISSTLKRKYSTPAQDNIKNEIAVLEKEINLLNLMKHSLNSDGNEQGKINKLESKIEALRKKLKAMELHTASNKKYRETIKQKLMEKPSTDGSQTTKISNLPGRPRLETNQPELLKTIADVAIFGASAEERRRCEIVRSCRSLDDLHEVLKELGYSLSRSALYLRLLPKRSNSIEGKLHVSTVAVKLKRPEADYHKPHADQHFCQATIRNLETVASILGPSQVCFISQDDKVRVPIGVTAANKQAPLLMSVEYRISLPDHDFVVAKQHKLIPSVYAGCIIKENNMGKPIAVTYSGPTYIAVRSGKHSTSNASTHAQDFKKLMELDNFKDIFFDEFGNTKPIVMISSDGGPDENPRFPKVINNAINHFIEYKFDVFIICTNAPGRSAFNRVERRMAPLSKELAGVILPHDTFGSHLDSQGRTVDVDLEKKNFLKAGNTLAELWSNMVIDNHNVVAEYIEPNLEIEKHVPPTPSPEWYSAHVRESQYMVQNKYSAVKADCTKALELNPRYVKALMRRARALERSNELETALEDITAACILEQFTNDTSLILADKLLKQLGSQHAQEFMATKKSIMPSNHFINTYFEAFRNDPILVDYDSQPQSVTSDLSEAIQAIRNQDYENVIPYCTKELGNLRADSTLDFKMKVHLLRGTFYLLLGEHHNAIADLDMIITNECVSKELRVNALIKRASMHVQLDDPEKSFCDFGMAIDLDPNCGDIYHNRAQVNLLLERIDEAKADFEKAAELHPDFGLIYVQKCYADYRYAASKKDIGLMAIAMSDFQEAFEKFPDCSECYTLYAQMLCDSQEYEKADYYFSKAIEKDPKNAIIHVHRGLLQLHWNKNVDKAVDHIKKALELDEKCEFGYKTLGSIEVQRGNLKEAISLFDKALMLGRTAMEVTHIFSLKDAAKTQLIVSERLGMNLVSIVHESS